MKNEFRHFTFILLKKKWLVKKIILLMEQIFAKNNSKNRVKNYVLDLPDKHTWELLR
jgi:hypothetical protein